MRDKHGAYSAFNVVLGHTLSHLRPARRTKMTQTEPKMSNAANLSRLVSLSFLAILAVATLSLAFADPGSIYAG